MPDKEKPVREFGILDTDGDMRKGLRVWQHHYLTARNDHAFNHKNAIDYARDKFRAWWRENVDSEVQEAF